MEPNIIFVTCHCTAIAHFCISTNDYSEMFFLFYIVEVLPAL